MKIHPVEAELFHAGGRTDMTKLIDASRDFVKSAYIRLRCISRYKVCGLRA